MFFTADLVASYIGGDPRNVKEAIFSFMVLAFAYITTFSLVWLCDLKWWRDAKYDASVTEDALRTRAKELVKKRQRMMNSVINTRLMYECMEEYLMDE